MTAATTSTPSQQQQQQQQQQPPRRRVDASSLRVAPTRVDWALEGTMAALLLFLPLAFGTVEAWSEMVALGLATLAAALLIVKSFTAVEGGGFVRTWAYVPLALLVLVAAFQIVPLPRGLVEVISSNAVETRTALLGDLDGVTFETLTLSLYPPATRHMMRVVLLAAVTFVVGVNLYRGEGQIKRVLGWVSIVGVGVALLALAQDLAGARAIYWTFPVGREALGGPFVNKNHFAQFMNLSIGAMLALLFVRLREHGRLGAGWTSRLLEGEHRTLLFLTGGIVVCAVALALSLSRGGILSMLAAFAVTGVVAASQRSLPGRGWALVVLGVLIFGAVSYFGLDLVSKRLATLENVPEASGARWQMNQDVLKGIVPKFPAIGIGLGAHEVVYPMYSRLPDAGLATHVENEYVQLVEEMGVVGVAIVVAFLAIIVSQYVRLVRRPERAVHGAAIGLGYGLLAAAVHSVSDFGQRMPANLCVSMLFCGLLIGVGRTGKPGSATGTNRHAKLLGAGGSLLLLVALGWSMFGAVRAANAEAHWNQALAIEAELAASGWSGASDEDLAELITLAGVAVENEPEDVHYRHGLNLYRWHAISREVDAETGNYVMDAEQVGYAARIAEELHGARRLCPTFGPALSLAGQIELFVLGKDSGEQHIRKGLELAPLDPTAWFVAGRLDAEQGDWAGAAAKFRRGVELGHPVEDVIDAYVRELRSPEEALAFAVGDGRALLYLAGALAEEKNAELAGRARGAAIAALRRDVEDEGATYRQHGSLAELLFAEKEYDGAAEHYRAALGGDYGNVGWRLRRAESLAAAGKVAEAMKEAKVCQRLRPESAAVTSLIERLSLQPAPPSAAE